MSDIKVNQDQWNQLPDDAKKQIEELINTSFEPKERISIIPDAHTPPAEGESDSPRETLGNVCIKVCMEREIAAIAACKSRFKPGKERAMCISTAMAAYEDCVVNCPPD
jgi:hypothetical protein